MEFLFILIYMVLTLFCSSPVEATQAFNHQRNVYPRHELKGNIDTASKGLRFVDDVTLWHPGGAEATFHFQLAKELKLRQVRWRDSTLEHTKEGANIVVPLPYMSERGPIKVSILYEGRSESLAGEVVLGRKRAYLPSIEGDRGLVSLRLKVNQGADVLASVAPVTRRQGRDGSLLVRFPEVPLAFSPQIIVSRWPVETIYAAGARIEVLADDVQLAQRASSLIGRIAEGLSFLLPREKSLRSFSFVLVADPEFKKLDAPGLAVVQSADEYLAPTTEEICKAATRLLWSSLSWAEDEASYVLLEGLTDYTATALLARRTSSPRFQRKLEHVIKTVSTSRPVPRWRRWRGKNVPTSERGFGFCYMLRGMVGNEEFANLLRLFGEEAKKKGQASAPLLQELLSARHKSAPKWLFSSYLQSGFLPDFFVQEVAIQEQQRPVELLYDSYGTPSDTGRYVSDIRLVQNSELRYTGTVGLRIETDVEKLDTKVEVNGRVAKLQVITARPPRKVIVDPAGILIEANEKNNALDVAVKRGRF
mgnify:CR=1 FL=1